MSELSALVAEITAAWNAGDRDRLVRQLSQVVPAFDRTATEPTEPAESPRPAESNRQAAGRPAGMPETGVSSRFGAARVDSVGALVLTRLTVRDADESAHIDELSVEITKALRSTRGFLGTLTADVGDEKFTVTAFTGPDATRAVHTRSHQRAVRKFFAGGMSTRAVISSWSPTSIREYARCPQCDEVRRLTDADSCRCDCGAELALSSLI